jgi:hypothetical protein
MQTTTLKRKKVKVRVGRFDISSYEEESLESLITTLTTFRNLAAEANLDDVKLREYSDDYYDHIMEIYGEREESDEEFSARVAVHEKSQEKKRARMAAQASKLIKIEKEKARKAEKDLEKARRKMAELAALSSYGEREEVPSGESSNIHF